MDHTWASHDLKSLGLDSAKDLSPELPGVTAGCPRCLWAQTLEQDPLPGGPVFTGCWGARDPASSLDAPPPLPVFCIMQ